MTGDLPAHNDWSQTKKGQVDIFNKMIDLFDEYLPNKPMFYSFGNHESDPVNRYMYMLSIVRTVFFIIVSLQILSLVLTPFHGYIMMLLTS